MPVENDLEAPYRGEHNFKVLNEYLGFSQAQVDALKAEGVLLEEDIPMDAVSA